MSVSLLLFAGMAAASFDFSAYPPKWQPAPANPAFTALYDLSKVPNYALNTPANSAGSPDCPSEQVTESTCMFLCGAKSCTRNTDVFQCPNKQDWGFSFDDGPSPYSPALLDWMKEKEVKATFCTIGYQILQYPEILQREYAEGHQIVIHTWSHRALTTMTNEVIVAELEWTARAIQQVIGVRPRYFRPPYGDLDDRVRAVAAAMGLIPIIWNYDTNDWSIYGTASKLNPKLPGAMVQAVGQRADGWKGDSVGTITLEHDVYQGSALQGPFVGQAILNAGMNLKPIAQCIGDSNPYVGGTFIPGVSPGQGGGGSGGSSSAVPVTTSAPPAVSSTTSVAPVATTTLTTPPSVGTGTTKASSAFTSGPTFALLALLFSVL